LGIYAVMVLGQNNSMVRAGFRWCGVLSATAVFVACQGESDDAPAVSADGGSAGSAGAGSQNAGSSGSSSGAPGAGGSTAGTGGTAAGQSGGGGRGGVGGSGGNLSGGGTAGSSGSGGSGGSGGNGSTCTPWPAATATEQVSQTIEVSGTYDGGLKRLVGVGALGTGSQNEDQPPFFRLANGATLKNVILGAPSADGVHCEGSCTLTNVWWEDVGEDAATLRGSSSSQIMTVECAGAKQAADKVFQHNGPGTMILRAVFVEDFGKLYRSCGNCSQQFARHVRLEGVTARNGSVLVGLNENYGDTAQFSNISVTGSITICQRYVGNSSGAEPYVVGTGPDAEHCLYEPSDIQ
jgi:hypothetical protein